MDLVVADERPNGRSSDHDLGRHGSAAPLQLRQQRLSDHALEHEGELRPDLGLLIRGENIDHAVDGLGRGVGVQGGEHQVAGLRDGQRRTHCLEVPHLSHQDDIRILAERVLQRRGEALGIGSDFPLIDETALVPVDELDRILDRDDMALPLLVDLVDDRRQRSRFARAGWAGHQDQSAGPLGQFGDDGREA